MTSFSCHLMVVVWAHSNINQLPCHGLSNHIHTKQSDVITHLCHSSCNFIVCLAKSQLMLVHGWVTRMSDNIPLKARVVITYSCHNLSFKIRPGGYVIERDKVIKATPDSKVHGANMGSTWVLSAPDGPHIGPMKLAIRYCPGWLHSLRLHVCPFQPSTQSHWKSASRSWQLPPFRQGALAQSSISRERSQDFIDAQFVRKKINMF